MRQPQREDTKTYSRIRQETHILRPELCTMKVRMKQSWTRSHKGCSLGLHTQYKEDSLGTSIYLFQLEEAALASLRVSS